MLYTILKVGDTEYKLRLTAQSAVDVEKKLGKSVLDVLLGMAPDNIQNVDASSIKGVSMPFVGDIVIILHGALQKYQHGITLENTYEFYDNYIDAGGSYMDFFEVLQDILKVSGFLTQGTKAVPTETTQPQEASPVA